MHFSASATRLSRGAEIVPQFRLNYDQCGPDGAECVLLVHGHLSSRNHWRPNLGALGEAYRLITVDLPAHGLSPAPADPDAYRVEAIVDALDGLRAELGVSDWHLIGQSFGAGVVLKYGLIHPETVRSVIFTNANRALLSPPEGEVWEDIERRAALLEAEGAVQLRKEAVHPRFARYYPEDIRSLLAAEADHIDPQGFAYLLRMASPGLSVRDKLHLLRCPVMLINGRHERKFQPIRDWLADTHPTIEIEDLDGGHSVNIENAEGFNSAVLAFLQRLPPEAHYRSEVNEGTGTSQTCDRLQREGEGKG